MCTHIKALNRRVGAIEDPLHDCHSIGQTSILSQNLGGCPGIDHDGVKEVCSVDGHGNIFHEGRVKGNVKVSHRVLLHFLPHGTRRKRNVVTKHRKRNNSNKHLLPVIRVGRECGSQLEQGLQRLNAQRTFLHAVQVPVEVH